MEKKLISAVYSYGRIKAGMSNVMLLVDIADEKKRLTMEIDHPNYRERITVNFDADALGSIHLFGRTGKP